MLEGSGGGGILHFPLTFEVSPLHLRPSQQGVWSSQSGNTQQKQSRQRQDNLVGQGVRQMLGVSPVVLPFWTPFIETSKSRGEANVSTERMASIRTMMMRTILEQCLSQTERAKLFCNKFWDLSDMIYESFR